MTTPIAFERALDFAYGEAADLSPLVRRVVANNPGAFTLHGTGTYVIGRGKVAIVDPGPDDAAHVAALLGALEGETVTHILVTHTHLDHSPATRALQAATGAPSYAFGPHGGDARGPQVEAGADWDFVPDVRVGDGETVAGDGWTVTGVHTPGHTSNHLCFHLAEENALFCGDHVMGWSTTIVSPPDGDMRAYMASLERLIARGDARYYPTHGAPIEAPQGHVRALLAHRHEREAQLLDCLADRPQTIPDMVAVVYADIGKHLHGAAARSVLAHLIHMAADGRVECDGAPTAEAVYRRPA